jgi:hypothetical protein
VVYLAYKTASRLGEVLGLTRSHLYLKEGYPDKFAIAWGALTKSGKKSPFDLRNFTMVALQPEELKYMWYVMSMKPEHVITPFPKSSKDSQRSRMVRRIQKVFPELSAHSFKRGALSRLMPLVKEKGLSPNLLPRLLKHKGESEPIPATTIRYASDPFAIADLGETESLTRLQW